MRPLDPLTAVMKTRYLLLLLMTFQFHFTSLFAEGSVDFVNFPGYRLYFNAEQQQQLKVYANVGEFINVGASHVGISGGFISIYRPDGTLHQIFDDAGSTSGLAIMYNHIQEQNGPTGGGSLNGAGYEPGVIQVPAGMDGIWTIKLEFPVYSTDSYLIFPLNSDPWDRAVHQSPDPRAICAWDITISQNAAGNDGGDLLKGRVYSNHLITIVDDVNLSTSPNIKVLTKEGFLYDVEFNDTKPWGFPIFSNSWGVTTHDFQPTYASHAESDYSISADPASWTFGNKYLYDPQAEDHNQIINNKIFFNNPDPNMPSTAWVTDVKNLNTHETWLFNDAPFINVDFHSPYFCPVLPADAPFVENVMLEDGAYIKFSSNFPGTVIAEIDIDNNGSFDDPEDRYIFKRNEGTQDSIFWNGRDGQGNIIPPQNDYTINVRLRLAAGEIHIMLQDVESSEGGVTFTRLNGLNAPESFWAYNHTTVAGGVSGPSVAFPEVTNEPYIYDNNWGNEKLLDYWTYFELPELTFSLNFDILDDISHLQPDTDGDGRRDNVDIDDDNDGILDLDEICQACDGFIPTLDPSADNDADGVANYEDANTSGMSCTDSDADGVCDFIIPAYDKDQDGVPNHLDLDDDNDGIVDIIEAGHTAPDLDGDGRIDGEDASFGLNGLYNAIATDPDDYGASTTYTLINWDGDDFPDFLDLNTDGDGIDDVVEAGFTEFDLNGDGLLDVDASAPPLVNLITGLANFIDPEITGNPVPQPIDTDLDLVPNWRDLDSDNDGISDVVEAGYPDPDNDGFAGVLPQTTNYCGQEISDGNGIDLSQEPILDIDGDGVLSYVDFDSDNDGIYDVAEGGGTDLDEDGIIGVGTPSVNAFGFPITDQNSQPILPTPEMVDTDGDGVMDAWDLDADNDGIDDVVEAFYPDPDGDGIIGNGLPNVNNAGVATSDTNGESLDVTSLPVDTDGDGIPTYQDHDADNDGILDATEAGFLDPDTNGFVGDGIPVVNANGQPITEPNGNPINTPLPNDQDDDGIADWIDHDSDNDGLFDTAENQFDDPDENGVIGNGNPVVDTFGIPISDGDGNPITSTDQLDTDNDGIPNSVDLDSDNDGIPDVKENQFPDTDFDSLIGVGEGVVGQLGTIFSDANGNPITISAMPIDTDTDGIPDFMDLDADNDGIADAIENPNYPICEDEDGDGIPDFQDESCDANLAQPQINGTTEVCWLDMIVLTSAVDPSWTGLLTSAPIVYEWTNANGDPIPFGASENTLVIPANDPFAIAPFYLNVKRGSCESATSAPFEVDINQLPPTLGTGAASAVCIGEEVQLNATFLEDASYQWRVNGSNAIISNIHNPIVQGYPDDTSFELTVLLPGCEAMIETTVITIFDPPEISPYVNYNLNLDCSPSDMSLTANPVEDNTNIASYLWTGPNNFNSTAPDPAIANADASHNGLYTLSVTDANGCTSEAFVNVSTVVDALPIPSIQTSGNNCEGEQFTLTVPQYEGNTSYVWSMPSGSITGANLNQLTFYSLSKVNHEGEYSLTVTVDGCVLTTETISVEVENIVSTFPLLSHTQICEGEDLTLLSNNPDGSTYEWYGPSGYFSDEVNPVIENASTVDNGNYLLVVTGANGCSATSNFEVNAIAPYFEEPIIEALNVSCQNGNQSLTVQGYDDVDATFNWITPSGEPIVGVTGYNTPTLDIQDLNAIYHDGAYQIEVIVNGCVKVSEPFSIVVEDFPSASPLVVNDDALCEGSELLLAANAGGYSTIQWTGPNGYISYVENPIIPNVSENDNGLYTLTLGNSEGCEKSYELNINTISETPEKPFILATNTVCSNENIELYVTNYNSTNAITQWVNANGQTVGEGSTISLAASQPNAISPFWAIVELDGCTSSWSDPVDVSIIDNVVLTIDQPETICEGVAFQLSANYIDNAIYHWKSLGISPELEAYGQQVEFQGLNESTMFELNVTGTSCIVNPTQQTMINIQETPTVDAIQGGGNYCAGEDIMLVANSTASNVFPVNYFWQGPNGFSEGGQASANNEFVLNLNEVSSSNSGTYSLLLETSEGCATIVQNVAIVVENTVNIPELFSNENALCNGDELLLYVNNYENIEAVYEWYADTGTEEIEMIATTAFPSLELQVDESDIAHYYVQIKMEDCISEPSNLIAINVVTMPEVLTASSNAPVSSPICTGEVLQLNADFYPDMNYEWIGPNAFSSDLPNPTIQNTDNTMAGIYHVNITSPACPDFDLTTSTEVVVNETPSTPVLTNSESLCEGMDASIAVLNFIDYDPSFQYMWYSMPGSEMVLTTVSNTLNISNVSLEDAGDYVVVVNNENCNSPVSNPVSLEVSTTNGIFAFAGTDEILCGNYTSDLTASLPSGYTGMWQSLGAAQVGDLTNPATAVTNLALGENLFIWSLSSPECTNFDQDTVSVLVMNEPEEEANAGGNITLCNDLSIALSAIPSSQSQGRWTQSTAQEAAGVLIENSNDPNTMISGLIAGNTYNFQWTLSAGICGDFSIDEMSVVVNQSPTTEAQIIGESDLTYCEDDVLFLEAETAEGTTGYWTTNTSATITNPNSSTTMVENIQEGNNVFTWTLSTPYCENFSATSVIVNYDADISLDAVEDKFVFMENESLTNESLLQNDSYDLTIDYEFEVLEYPKHGTLEFDNGIFSYQQDEGYYGEDAFVYQICHPVCIEICDYARVELSILNNISSENCFVPNTITPNADGFNDVFEVNCLEDYPENEVVIFNRWGTKIYAKKPYFNEFDGTFKGADLPVGTYYYILKLNDDYKNEFQGFFTIVR